MRRDAQERTMSRSHVSDELPSACPARQLNARGNALLRLKRFDEARAAYQAAIAADPACADPHANLAALHQALGETEAAIEFYRRFLDLAPTDGEAHHNLGVLLMSVGERERAQAAFEQAAKHLSTESPEQSTFLGVSQFFLGKHDEALAIFGRALSLDPDWLPARYHLGATLLATGRAHEAVIELGMVVEAQPDYPQARENLGVALNAIGRPEAAVVILEEALARTPKATSARLNLACAYQDSGRLGEARTAFEDVLAASSATAAERRAASEGLASLGEVSPGA